VSIQGNVLSMARDEVPSVNGSFSIDFVHVRQSLPRMWTGLVNTSRTKLISKDGLERVTVVGRTSRLLYGQIQMGLPLSFREGWDYCLLLSQLIL
jgi:hypothetical protein